MASDDSVSNQVLLKLLIKGMDPAEVQRLAQQTYGQLKTEAAVHIDALTAYYKQAQAAQDDASKASAEERIKNETEALDAVTKLLRQQEIQMNKQHESWHRVMEDLENITTVARGAWDVINEGYERFKRLGEDVAKTTNIYGALKGSIDEMRKSTEGEVADIDLIEAKNRGFQESLKLTDEQYGAVASAAHNFAKVLGVDTKEALDKLIQGLATGRVRTLEMVGVTVNADEANKEYAKSIGKTVDQLTDHDKKNAILQESLKAMDRKIVESGGVQHTFASEYEKTMAQMQNMHDKLLLGLGQAVVSFMEHWERVPDKLRIIMGKIQDLFPGQSGHADEATAEALAHQAERDAAGTRAAQEAVTEANARLASGGKAYAGASTGFGTDQVKGGGKKDAYEPFGPGGDDFAGGTHKATFLGESGDQAIYDAQIAKADEAAKAITKIGEAEEKEYVLREKIKGLTIDTASAYEKYAKSLGVLSTNLTNEEKMQALQNEAMVQADKLAVEAKRKADARRAELKATQNKAGFMGIFLWGTEGPEETYKEMDLFQQKMVDTMGQISASLTADAEKMTNAIGKSLGASIAGAEGAKLSLRQQTHDALQAIAEQAAGKALWEGAEALASLAMYDYPGAALHGAAAAAYGGVAIAAGLSARAVGNSPAAATKSSAAGSGSGLSQSSSNSFGSGSRSSSTGADVTAPVTINMTVLPGGEAEAGRSVVRALTALQNQTGQSVQPLLASG